jgi:hypothetical protein
MQDAKQNGRIFKPPLVSHQYMSVLDVEVSTLSQVAGPCLTFGPRLDIIHVRRVWTLLIKSMFGRASKPAQPKPCQTYEIKHSKSAAAPGAFCGFHLGGGEKKT